MSCPTCDHTMESLGASDRADESYFHCPRCGTVVVRDDTALHGDVAKAVYVPRLVERCRAFEKALGSHEAVAWFRLRWRTDGIAEAINLPAQSPQT